MGNYFFRKELTEDSNYDHSVQFKRPQNKRKRTINQNEDTEDATDSLQACTKRQRNDEAIYHQYTLSKLFFNDENGDTTIEALGYKWKMHKICLIRAGYFKSMFSGFWQESKATYVKIEMIDKNITVNAINTAFASLYDDDTEIKSSEAISIVAVATMLQIDNLIKRCTDVMIATISEENERTFREAASAYGLLEVHGLACTATADYQTIRLDAAAVYRCKSNGKNCKLSIFACAAGGNGCICDVKEGSTNFLVTEEGKVFSLAFRQLKFNHIITDTKIARQIEKDRIISQDWLLPIYRQEWRTLLAVEEGDDFGSPKRISLKRNISEHDVAMSLSLENSRCIMTK
ncbi:uncharacterized protein TRIADDRAFT_52379 [Trichoplax adhaerens]|uniref:BTB domain-containing protein n=1 Tax=Trichoplax adhaerens TaxID=10228 RepID=B3RI78_TRIAD|nr:hypothetical protein TRIADDRAFT_52379 [Trichoplax adhaerens]EDV29704.1 hypothetical protein TRIADDRAFT_52379 [Trichoplax adhaerens]|eukprot:XP_002108906.1 hypothetical protein TRIADDRAFT_52379 [Trichoplax adhaerens]